MVRQGHQVVKTIIDYDAQSLGSILSMKDISGKLERRNDMICFIFLKITLDALWRKDYRG